MRDMAFGLLPDRLLGTLSGLCNFRLGVTALFLTYSWSRGAQLTSYCFGVHQSRVASWSGCQPESPSSLDSLCPIAQMGKLSQRSQRLCQAFSRQCSGPVYLVSSSRLAVNWKSLVTLSFQGP